MSRFYKLVDKLAVPVSTSEHMAWVTSHPQGGSVHVCESEFTDGQETVRVSTVFLMGINHRWMENEEPLLFETMVFGGNMTDSKWRYSTWEQAEDGHRSVLEQLFREMPNLRLIPPQEPVVQRESIPTRFERVITNLCPSQKS